MEVGDWHRFTGVTIGAYLGLVPSEHSSGASRVQGSITKTGNTHARRLLVEAAWHHRPTYRQPGAVIRARWQGAEPAVVARAHAGNQRLHARWQAFTTRRKRPVIANVAIARARRLVLVLGHLESLTADSPHTPGRGGQRRQREGPSAEQL